MQQNIAYSVLIVWSLSLLFLFHWHLYWLSKVRRLLLLCTCCLFQIMDHDPRANKPPYKASLKGTASIEDPTFRNFYFQKE